MSRVSKADEATSWRRPVPSNDHNKQSSSYRPASAGGSSAYSRVQQPAASAAAMMMQALQPQQPRQPTQSGFNVVEAQALLEQRWTALCQQGLKPTCQCNAAQQDGAAADGSKHASEGHFLQALKAAADSKTADAAWDDG